MFGESFSPPPVVASGGPVKVCFLKVSFFGYVLGGVRGADGNQQGVRGNVYASSGKYLFTHPLIG